LAAPPMNPSRRQFVATAAALAIGLDIRKAFADSATQPTGDHRIDAGPASDFASDNTYDIFRDQGFFIISQDHKITALSSVCTHKGCKVTEQKDHSFICKCHKSEFDRDGKVTQGPATKDLPHLAVTIDDQHHVLVDLDQKLAK
jgi:Rieske Fe-S protein